MEKKITYPDPETIYPLGDEHNVVFIKNIVNNPNIKIGDFSYYHGFKDNPDFNDCVLYHFDFMGDKLIIGKFCAIASGVKFIMNGANHKISALTTYPFRIMGSDWKKFAPEMSDLPYKGDTIIGNDVWIGYESVVMPGVKIGNGAIIASKSVVTSDIPPYSLAGGNPCKVIRYRFDDESISFLNELKWWDFKYEIITEVIPYLMNSDFEGLKNYLRFENKEYKKL